jgi:hypothetical protein
VLIALVALMALMAMVVSVGFWRYEQRLQQTAADSAALAGAVEYTYTTTLATITTAAQTDAASNGFTNGVSNTTVTVNVPPLSGAYAGTGNSVEVIVAKQQPAYFTRLFGQTARVSARAVAILSTANRNCIVALDTDNSAITLDGATLTIPKCGIVSDGGYLLNGGGTIDAASIGYNPSAGNTFNSETFSAATPAPAIPAADPCPTIPGCAYLKANPPTSGTCVSTTTYDSSSTITLSPGNYCSQVLFEGGGNVVFNAGVYNFSGGFTNNNNAAQTMSGTGVTFYASGGIIVGSKCTVNLSAPTTGNTAGVLVYQPVSDTSGFTINGASGGSWAGMIYLPAGQLTLNGGSFNNSLLIVADDILLNNATSISVPTAAFPGYSGHAVLGE